MGLRLCGLFSVFFFFFCHVLAHILELVEISPPKDLMHVLGYMPPLVKKRGHFQEVSAGDFN